MSAQSMGGPQFLDEKFKKALKVSGILHVSLILFFTVKVYFIPDEIIDYQSALRVDLVALPEKNLNPVPEPAAPEALPEKPVPRKRSAPKEDTVVLNPTKKSKADLEKKQQDALNKLKQMSAFEKLQAEAAQDKPVQKQVYAGNQIATGSDLKGLSRIQHDNYIGQVERHIRRNWALPQWLANKKLRTQVRVKIDSSGNVLSKDVVRSSGNPSFDEVAVETIEKSSPVPVPPDKLARLLANEGILFGFPD